MASQRRSGSTRDNASKIRSDPDGWETAVITAFAPASRTAASTFGSSQATHTGPTSASSARRTTWTIIGRPAMSASGFPGSRVEAIRAGIKTTGRLGAARPVEVMEFEYRDEGRRQATYPRLPSHRKENGLTRTGHSARIRLKNQIGRASCRERV